MDSGCGVKTRLLDIPDAENLLFTPSGRLFVSGGQNVYEITRPGGVWTATAIAAASCNFTGLALRGQVLYANCFDGTLWATALGGTPQLRPIATLTGVTAGNGLATGPGGELYAVNGPTALAPKLVRLRFGADPFTVTEQSDWLTFTAATAFPNGVQVRGSELYLSLSQPPSLGRIVAVPIQADGSPGAQRVVAELGSSLPDDFSFVGDAILAALYSDGRINLFAADGTLRQQTALLSFDSPSQVRVGQPPLFAATDLVITEKGLIGEHQSGIGNALSVFRRR